MSEALPHSPTTAARPDRGALRLVEPLVGSYVNDNAPPQQPESRLFEMPGSIWRLMVSCYGVFLLTLLGATGGAHAAFAIVVSGVYVAMFFGTSRTVLRHAPPQPRSALERPGSYLQTACGPLSRGAVYGQVLIVPAAVASFGVAIAILSALLM